MTRGLLRWVGSRCEAKVDLIGPVLGLRLARLALQRTHPLAQGSHRDPTWSCVRHPSSVESESNSGRHLPHSKRTYQHTGGASFFCVFLGHLWQSPLCCALLRTGQFTFLSFYAVPQRLLALKWPHSWATGARQPNPNFQRLLATLSCTSRLHRTNLHLLSLRVT